MLSNNIYYKGFIACYGFDKAIGSYVAKVVNSDDTILCDGRSPKDVRKSMIDSIDLYLELCAKKGLINHKLGK